jgi:hypothetical protein
MEAFLGLNRNGYTRDDVFLQILITANSTPTGF